MPIKIFAAPGDHRDDFENVESQFNQWAEQARPNVTMLQCAVTPLSEKRDYGNYMLTLVVLYERS